MMFALLIQRVAVQEQYPLPIALSIASTSHMHSTLDAREQQKRTVISYFSSETESESI